MIAPCTPTLGHTPTCSASPTNHHEWGPTTFGAFSRYVTNILEQKGYKWTNIWPGLTDRFDWAQTLGSKKKFFFSLPMKWTFLRFNDPIVDFFFYPRLQNNKICHELSANFILTQSVALLPATCWHMSSTAYLINRN